MRQPASYPRLSAYAGSGLLLCSDRYLLFVDFATERGESDFEQSGSLCLVAARVSEHLDDVALFHAFQIEAFGMLPPGLGREYVDG